MGRKSILVLMKVMNGKDLEPLNAHSTNTYLLGTSEEGVKVYDVVIQLAEGPRISHRLVFTCCWSLGPGTQDSRDMPLTPVLRCLLRKMKVDS